MRKKSVLALLLLVALLASFAGCSGDSTVDILDAVPELDTSKEESIEVSVADPEPAEGQTAMPIIKQYYNTTQTTVAILGTCEADSVINATLAGGGKTSVNANGTVFVIEVEVGDRPEAHIQLTATAPDKTESDAKNVVTGYSSITDGNLVYPTVLADKATLFLQSSLDILSDDVLRTNTAAKAFTDKINGYINTLKNMGETELIYVLMPSKSSAMTDMLPEGTEVTDGITLYEQAVAAIKASDATLIDMKAVLAEAELEDYPLYYRTHSAWSEYGAYLTYVTLMNYIAEKYPDAAPKGLDEFEIKEVKDALGGDLAYHFGLDGTLLTETFYDFVPKFDLDMGDSAPEDLEVEKTWLISGIKQYVGDNDYKFYDSYFANKLIHKDPAYTLVDSTFGFYTGRDTLPTAFIYRDEATYGAVDMLAERFNNCMFEAAGAFNVNASKASDYAAEGKKNVDYIIVMVSEENLPTLIPNND